MSQIADGSFFEQVSIAFKAGDPDFESKQREAGHVRCVQLMYHAIARNAFAECLDLATDDLVLEILGPSDSPFNGRWQGKAEVQAAMERNFAVVKEQRPKIETVVAQGDTVIVIAHESGQMASGEATYEMHWVQQFNFANGKVNRMREIVDGSANWNTGEQLRDA